MPLLDVENLTIDIPTEAGLLHAVNGISFTLERGETLAIVGESGSGKSLTSLALMDLLPSRAVRRADTMRFDGIDLMAAGEREKENLRGDRMAMIFQEPMTSLNPAYTIGDQLAEALRRHRRVDRRAARERAVHLLERVGITAAASRLGQYPHQLSGGLRQRVMIAMALMCEPDLIVADEPTTALDVTIQAQILKLLRDLQQEFGMALILVTHDLGVVARVATKVAVMYAGRFVEAGPVEAVFGAPSHPYTQGLLRSIPVPGRTRPGEPLGTIPGQVPNLVGTLTGCMFRNRCDHAAGRCAEEVPDRTILPGHRMACILEPTLAGGRPQ
ncbi:peptide ABC transporter substrate-binding protein [Azospirillum thiophilum]|uniref:Peptide ABC transporter substrate-binding protein n=1 Tax=Azospirillum thiophilum TaxID=528244 RepID=A0AAC8ZV22_9PROT|nr:ABC transporter ATP-binding protein [Azospirillum thiophilum]ALG72832.1 peptide ABC transporter substrate-binding protein [Azospirillum thiophilum]KJR64250.1 peptide ABC transporter substrate-binding protein [Azospirillum thiophilum]